MREKNVTGFTGGSVDVPTALWVFQFGHGWGITTWTHLVEDSVDFFFGSIRLLEGGNHFHMKKNIIKHPIFRGGGGFDFLIFTPIWGR